MIIRDEITKSYLGIKCDADMCEAMAPPNEIIRVGHGLNNMGWRCSGGTHFCPTHAVEEDLS